MVTQCVGLSTQWRIQNFPNPLEGCLTYDFAKFSQNCMKWKESEPQGGVQNFTMQILHWYPNHKDQDKNIGLHFHLFSLFVADGVKYDRDIPPFLSESNNTTLRFVTNFLRGQGVLMSYILSKLLDRVTCLLVAKCLLISKDTEENT